MIRPALSILSVMAPVMVSIMAYGIPNGKAPDTPAKRKPENGGHRVTEHTENHRRTEESGRAPLVRPTVQQQKHYEKRIEKGTTCRAPTGRLERAGKLRYLAACFLCRS